jgi:Pilus assembly protein, PilO
MTADLNLSGRIAALLAGAVVLLVLLVGWFLLVSPQRSKAADLSGKITDTQNQIASTQAYVNSPVTKQAVHDLKGLQTALPDDARMSQILRQLSAVAGAAGVSLDTITPAVAVPSSGGEALPITLAVTGHYVNISRFLQILRSRIQVSGSAIHGAGRLYSVDSIQFAGGVSVAPTGTSGAATTTGTTPAGGGAITATLALNAFIYNTTPAVPTTTTPTGTTTTSTTTTSTTTTPGP